MIERNVWSGSRIGENDLRFYANDKPLQQVS